MTADPHATIEVLKEYLPDWKIIPTTKDGYLAVKDFILKTGEIAGAIIDGKEASIYKRPDGTWVTADKFAAAPGDALKAEKILLLWLEEDDVKFGAAEERFDSAVIGEITDALIGWPENISPLEKDVEQPRRKKNVYIKVVTRDYKIVFSGSPELLSDVDRFVSGDFFKKLATPKNPTQIEAQNKEKKKQVSSPDYTEEIMQEIKRVSSSKVELITGIIYCEDYMRRNNPTKKELCNILRNMKEAETTIKSLSMHLNRAKRKGYIENQYRYWKITREGIKEVERWLGKK
ncbi:hypothetical protein MTAT_16980 [Moorella thermoacetica]|uniref:Uncharacterized protein n=1 Tax=Neomoorella thermoacetica TaxID=1525 RepID=A0AAC9HG59_NEOTH|nr:hypothetical protein [Moorella thermoacetica]AOQ23168.1 hypothetical protein Maut_00705 [Moorella thermoacetica]TYL12875.1 hypothetical protein MTAT_16980 [Moorella thermoacetica]